MLVFNGFGNVYPKSEVIDLLDETNKCEYFEDDYPYWIIGASGGLVEVLGRYGGLGCGGRHIFEIESRCFLFFDDATTVIGMLEFENHKNCLILLFKLNKASSSTQNLF